MNDTKRAPRFTVYVPPSAYGLGTPTFGVLR